MEQIIKRRGIKLLYHFTLLDNLESIIANGIVTRTYVAENGITATFNDELRLDHHENATCLSIAHPNYKLFYTFRQKNTDKDWVVIGLHPQILIDKNCSFYPTNAASALMLSLIHI